MAETNNSNQTSKTPFYKKPVFRNSVIGVVAIIIIFGFVYWFVNRNRIYTDDAIVQAPEIALSPDQAGILRDIYVEEGDTVSANEPVARVGDQLVKTNIAGIVIGTNNTIGTFIN